MTPRRLNACLLPLAIAQATAWADDEPVHLKLSQSLASLVEVHADQAKARELPMVIDADKLHSVENRYVEASGNVKARDLHNRFEADWLSYDKDSDEMVAKGNVVVARDEDTLRGTDVRLRVDDRIGVMNSLQYEISRVGDRKGQGTAKYLRFEGPDRYTLSDATYSTCPKEKQDWVFRAKDLALD
jgi:LPS-assembly protein